MKRANGTGSIVNLGPNRRRRYAVRVSYQARPGVYKQKYLSYHATVKEAQAALDAYLHTGVPAYQLGATLEDIYEAWKPRKLGKVSKSSMDAYASTWKRLSHLAKKPIAGIQIDDLQAVVDYDAQRGASKSILNNDRVLIRALWKYAQERNIVQKNLADFLDIPTVDAKFEKGSFTEEQIKKLFQLADSGFPYADTALILCYTGFRIGEFLALTPKSYDGQFLIGGSKTAAGKNRTVPVHPRIVPYVEKWVNRKERITQIAYRNKFSVVAEQIGVPQATPHWCRHTAATRMQEAGLNPLAIKRILGHSDKDVTEHYTHLSSDFLASEMAKLP